ncbi:FAST kinase domain-containing protein 1, mitochondrial-like [Homarus americanus]|uniref:FAST kinase domain-containing protein 1, mitochondrial-like n=1 Tax=Homarus americanus TaxID=6706 RepID=UPI001C47E881|nr:FAST kinase domain-containing protein 1, mitochondrial-like [Homarus americanus]XP_042241938.1 FAST kinase domain-containing protein 1, mitochondrial-like [Homarus americanus]
MQRVGFITSYSMWMTGPSLINSKAVYRITYLQRLRYQRVCCINQHHSKHNGPQQAFHNNNCLRIICGWMGVFTPAVIRTQSRYYVTQTSDDDFDDSGIISDSEFDIDGLDRDRTLSKDQFDLLRVNLYQNSNDPIVKTISQANSLQEVFDTIDKCRDFLTAEQSSQAIVTLWDLQKVYGRYGLDYSSVTNFQLNTLLEKILNHPTFEKLLKHLENVCEDLNNTAISCMLLYLNKIGLRTDAPLMQKLSVLCLERLNNFNLNSLSRLTVYLRDQGIKAYFLQSKLLPIVADKLRTCSTLEELHLITICLNSTKKIITESLINEYRKFVEKNLEAGNFETCDPKVILKIIKLLNYSKWSSKHYFLCRQLMLCLVNRMPSLGIWQVIDLSNYFQNFLEPREIFTKIQQYSVSQIEVSKNSITGPELLYLAPFGSLNRKKYFEELVAEQLDNAEFYDYIGVIFKTLRYIKTSNTKLCNAFWTKSMKAVEREIDQTTNFQLGFEEILRRKVYHRYMYFNNNLGGTYRNYHMEKNMSSLLLKDIRSPTGLVPNKLASMSAFLISYDSREGLPEDIVEKIIQYGSQFTSFDVLNLSRGVQITLALNPKNTRRRLMEQITAICRMLDTCAEEQLKTAKSLIDVTTITRAYLSRHGSPRTFLFDKLVHAHLPFLHELNSRLLRDICYFFYTTKHLAPQILDALAQYVVDNQEYILVDTIERLLSCLYTLGHYPATGQQFFSACTNSLSKDAHQLSGLNILQLCLGLNMYGQLSSKLIHNIFNLSFLDKLDEEISGCYSKATYPARVRHMLMELNRAVCIDHPEEKIPWFHEKYCEELLETVAVPNSVFHTEVHQALSQLVGGPDVLRANVKTPYYYLLDFEFLLDEENQPVPVKEYISPREKSNTSDYCHIENKAGYRRMAVLLHKESSYCINSRQLMGRHQVERRHLEMLGYTVIEVPHFMWYSMAHATFSDKMEYLKNILYSQTS